MCVGFMGVYGEVRVGTLWGAIGQISGRGFVFWSKSGRKTGKSDFPKNQCFFCFFRFFGFFGTFSRITRQQVAGVCGGTTSAQLEPN